MLKKIRLSAALSIIIGTIFTACSSSNYFVKKNTDFKNYSPVGIIVKPIKGYTDDQSQSIGSEFAGIELSKKGFSVVEHFYKRELMREQTLKMAGLYDEDPAELGKLKSVKSLLIITFPKYEIIRNRQGGAGVEVLGAGMRTSGKDMLITEVSVSIRLVSVETGEVLFFATDDMRLRGDRLRDAAQDVVRSCLNRLPGI